MSHEFLARFTGPGTTFLLPCFSPIRQLLVPPLYHLGHLAGLAVVVYRLYTGGNIHQFTPLAAFIALSDTRRACLQGGGFLVSASLIPSSPVSEVYGVFNNRVLVSSSGEQPRTINHLILEKDAANIH